MERLGAPASDCAFMCGELAPGARPRHGPAVRACWAAPALQAAQPVVDRPPAPAPPPADDDNDLGLAALVSRAYLPGITHASVQVRAEVGCAAAGGRGARQQGRAGEPPPAGQHATANP